VIRHLPNALTLLRLLLAAPLGIFILQQHFLAALAVGAVAGATDALDGALARRLGVLSRFGAALDPIADKVLVLVAFLCSAQVGLVPWPLALLVIARDFVIVMGATLYMRLVGPIEFAARPLSKCNMFMQVSFCLLVLLSQSALVLPPALLYGCGIAVALIAVASGLDYVVVWSVRARRGSRPG